MKQPEAKENPAGRAESTRASDVPEAAPGRKRTRIMIAAGVIALVLAVLGAGYYKEYVAPLRRVVLTVDAQDVRMDYFLKRTKLAGGDSMAQLQSMANELVTKFGAPRYGISVTADDVEKELRGRASSGDKPASDDEFKEWYRQQLNEMGLADRAYRDIVRTSIMTDRMRTYLQERVPTSGEQLHVFGILAPDADMAAQAKKLLDAGRDFAEVAAGFSTDPSAERGGELGWVPRGVLDDETEKIVFGLPVGGVSETVPQQDGVHIYKVTEKAADRKIDDAPLQALKNKALTKWLAEETKQHTVRYYYDSDTYAWINAKLAKGKPETTTPTPGG
ncbi:MAG: peptidylprolyl isomerase [Chloroflexi bacterium]|nr:peptidylprolyl isomerase [Chloroflexota bacterium]